MHWLGSLLGAKLWIAIWTVVLFVALLPLPPVAELVILVGFLAHSGWFVARGIRRAARRRAQARAEKADEEEYRRQRRRRSPSEVTPVAMVRGDLSRLMNNARSDADVDL